MGGLARAAWPKALLRAALRAYVRVYGVDMREAAKPLDEFESFTQFFTRELRDGARPVSPDPDTAVSPCDGRVHAVGEVADGRIHQDERRTFALEALLGEARADLEGTSYAVIYLSPRDYHRVHAPVGGEVARFRYLPGRLWPVFPAATRRIDGLFSGNERLVAWMCHGGEDVAIVFVGAFGVGRIRVEFDETVSNARQPAVERRLEPAWGVAKGAELGRFELGSTVILLMPRSYAWTVAAGDTVRVGAPIARRIR